MLKYKNYIGTVEYDDEAEIFHGEVINTRDVITFQAATMDEAEQAFRDSVDDYLAFCKEKSVENDTREFPEEYKGVKIVARPKWYPEKNKYGVAGAIEGIPAGAGGVLNYLDTTPTEWRDTQEAAAQRYIELAKSRIDEIIG